MNAAASHALVCPGFPHAARQPADPNNIEQCFFVRGIAHRLARRCTLAPTPPVALSYVEMILLESTRKGRDGVEKWEARREDDRGQEGRARGGDSEKKIRRLRCTILSTTSLYETLRFQMIFGSVDILTNGNYFRAFLMNHAYVEREGCELSAKGAHVRGIFLRQG